MYRDKQRRIIVSLLHYITSKFQKLLYYIYYIILYYLLYYIIIL